MLAETIIRIGRPIAKSHKLDCRERIRWLTDVSSESCKNFFQNVFVVEIGEQGVALSRHVLGRKITKGRKENFEVDQKHCLAFPVLLPNGGNPLNAQGIYPIPCYLMYDAHIKAMMKRDEFIKVLLPRLQKTVSYHQMGIEEKERLAQQVSEVIEKHANEIVSEGKQLGVLMIFDEKLDVYKRFDLKKEDPDYIWIQESQLYPGHHLYLSGKEALRGIIDARFDEAKTLGSEKNAISTFTNVQTDEVASIYNKSWLWLSPTWEMPKSIYWSDKDWIKGIRIDKESYEAFLYGTQYLKKIQAPISSGILKEMFAPVMNVEAKKHMNAASFETIYGIPMVYPLLDGDAEQHYNKLHRILKNEQNSDDLQLKILAGIDNRIVPGSGDDYRLTILYYSGDLTKGNMHIRAMIEDVIPSIAKKLQLIMQKLNREVTGQIKQMFEMESDFPIYRTETLPSLLANAYGPGYVWSSLQKAFHKQRLTLDRLKLATMKKLNELANKADYWGMKQELVFYHSFAYFLNQYNQLILGRDVKPLTDWRKVIDDYRHGMIKVEDLENAEMLGFVCGLLLKQFSNSYYRKTGRDFVKHRVMKFGSKLTPEMIWKNGALRCEELAAQWDMGLGSNFRVVLPQVLLAFIESANKKWLFSKKDTFMTAFWSGYLMYNTQKENEDSEEVIEHVHQ